MLRLALPSLAEQLLNMFVGFADTWLAGHLLAGDEFLAAMTMSSYLLWLLGSVTLFVSTGTTALVARLIGAGQPSSASHAMHQSFLLGIGLGALVVFVGVFGAPALMRIAGLEAQTAALVIQYLNILLPVIPIYILQQIGFAALRGAGDTVTGLIVMFIVNVVNVAFSAGFVTGWYALPELGWRGLAVGTAVAYAVGGAVLAAVLFSRHARLRVRLDFFSPDLSTMRRLLSVGLPAGLDSASLNVCQLWFLAIINNLGNLAAAAHGIAIRVEALAYLPGTAFQVAAATLAGQYLGAGDERRATKSVLMACTAGGALMTAAGIIFYFWSYELAGLFVSPEQMDIARAASPLLKTVAFVMPALAILMVFTGALRGAGDTRWPLAVTLVGFVGVRIPLAYLLAWQGVTIFNGEVVFPGAGLGVQGAWFAMAADLTFRCALISYRFLGGSWRSIQV